VNHERFSEGGRTLAIFEGGKDLRSSGRTHSRKKKLCGPKHRVGHGWHMRREYSSIMN